MMEASARARYVRIPPRKLRLVGDIVRGKGVEEALRMLPFVQRRGSKVLLKTLQSAISNLASKKQNLRVEAENLYIKEVKVDEGPRLKRFRAASMGRVALIKHRLSHLTVVVAEHKEGGEA